jgi:signal transduction histidine kinase/CheY-like chemotaxis protein/HAMP domain-containing protein
MALFTLRHSVITQRLLVWFLLIALLPVTTLTTILYVISSESLQREVTDGLEAITADKAQQIETYVLNRQRDVTALANTPTTITAFAALETLAKTRTLTDIFTAQEYTALLEPTRPVFNFYREFSDYQDILMISPAGDLLYTTKRTADLGTNFYTGPYKNTQLAKVIDNAKTLIQTELSDFDRFQSDSEPVAFIAAPVFKDGRIIGVIAIENSNRSIYNVVTNRIGLDQTGETLVASYASDRATNQLMITAPLRFDPDAAFKRTVKIGSGDLPALQDAIRGNRGQGEMRDYRGETVIAAWRYLPSLRWGLVVKKDTAEAFAPITNQRNAVIALLILTVIAIIVAGLTAAQSFTRPLLRLTHAVEAVSDGDLSVRVSAAADANPRDEMTVLTTGFNGMTQQLESLVTHLEDRIEVRTAQLMTATNVAREIVTLRRTDELLAWVTNLIQTSFKLHRVAILRPAEGNLTLAAVSGQPNTLPADQEVTFLPSGEYAWVNTHRTHRMISDLSTTAKRAEFPPNVRSVLLLPLQTRDTLLGILDLQSDRPNTFTETDLPSFQILADLITAALENARLYEQSQQYAEDMAKARLQAEQANRSKSTFLANMSHELRTPMNAILGFTQILERDKQLAPKQREHIGIIGRSGEHLLGLINDVLEMSKIEAGQLQLQESPYELPKLFTTVEEMLRGRATAKKLQLLFDISGNLPAYVNGDESKLRQVLINILGNAIKFTDEGGIALRATFDPVKNLLKIEIEDSGRGIPTEDLEKIFTPFGQSQHATRSSEGTGLGLTISRQFIQLMNGTINVKSQVDIGTIFTIMVPLKPVSALQVTQSALQRRVIGFHPDHRKEIRVLVVDDRPENRQLMVEWLTQVGFLMREAENGLEALQVWGQWKPHLIWMDMRMPVMDGYEATRRIKATLEGQATVIIALTASAFEDEKSIVLAAGCDEFVRKPARESTIFNKIEEFLGLKYIYEDEVIPTTVNPSEELTATQIQRLPVDIQRALRKATQTVDMEATYAVITQIEQINPSMATTLKELVDNFRFDQLQVLVAETTA